MIPIPAGILQNGNFFIAAVEALKAFLVHGVADHGFRFQCVLIPGVQCLNLCIGKSLGVDPKIADRADKVRDGMGIAGAGLCPGHRLLADVQVSNIPHRSRCALVILGGDGVYIKNHPAAVSIINARQMIPFACFNGNGFRPGLVGVVGTSHMKDKTAPAGLKGCDILSVFIGKARNKDKGIALELGLFIQLDPAAEGQLIGHGAAENAGNRRIQAQHSHIFYAFARHRDFVDHGVFVHAVIEIGVDAAFLDLPGIGAHAAFRIVLAKEGRAGLVAVGAAVSGGPEQAAAHGFQAVGGAVIPPAQNRGQVPIHFKEAFLGMVAFFRAVGAHPVVAGVPIIGQILDAKGTASNFHGITGLIGVIAVQRVLNDDLMGIFFIVLNPGGNHQLRLPVGVQAHGNAVQSIDAVGVGGGIPDGIIPALELRKLHLFQKVQIGVKNHQIKAGPVVPGMAGERSP